MTDPLEIGFEEVWGDGPVPDDEWENMSRTEQREADYARFLSEKREREAEDRRKDE